MIKPSLFGFLSKMTEIVQNPINQVPIMTSYILPSGEVNASSTNYGMGSRAWMAFNRNFDDSWFSNPSSSTPQWLQYQFSSPKSISSYTLFMGGGIVSVVFPKAWTFEGSNNGTIWTILDTQTNQVLNSQVKQDFDLPNNANYSYFRINNMVGSCSNIYYVTITEMEIIGTDI